MALAPIQRREPCTLRQGTFDLMSSLDSSRKPPPARSWNPASAARNRRVGGSPLPRDDEALAATILAGAGGYLVKLTRSGAIVRAIRNLQAGASLRDAGSVQRASRLLNR